MLWIHGESWEGGASQQVAAVGMWATGNADIASLDDIRAEGVMVAGIDVCAAAAVDAAAEGSSRCFVGREDQWHRFGALLAGKVEYRRFE